MDMADSDSDILLKSDGKARDINSSELLTDDERRLDYGELNEREQTSDNIARDSHDTAEDKNETANGNFHFEKKKDKSNVKHKIQKYHNRIQKNLLDLFSDSASARDHLIETFRSFDQNKSLHVDLEEFCRILRHIGLTCLSKDELKEVYVFHAKSEDVELDYEEWITSLGFHKSIENSLNILQAGLSLLLTNDSLHCKEKLQQMIFSWLLVPDTSNPPSGFGGQSMVDISSIHHDSNTYSYLNASSTAIAAIPGESNITTAIFPKPKILGSEIISLQDFMKIIRTMGYGISLNEYDINLIYERCNKVSIRQILILNLLYNDQYHSSLFQERLLNLFQFTNDETQLQKHLQKGQSNKSVREISQLIDAIYCHLYDIGGLDMQTLDDFCPPVSSSVTLTDNHDTSAIRFKIKKLVTESLPNVEILSGQNDPYIIVSLIDSIPTTSQSVKWKQKTWTQEEGGSNVHWNIDQLSEAKWSTSLPLEDISLSSLVVEVYDANKLRSDQLIGRGQMPLSGLVTTHGEVALTIPLLNEKQTSAGIVTITLIVTKEELMADVPASSTISEGSAQQSDVNAVVKHAMETINTALKKSNFTLTISQLKHIFHRIEFSLSEVELSILWAYLSGSVASSEINDTTSTIVINRQKFLDLFTIQLEPMYQRQPVTRKDNTTISATKFLVMVVYVLLSSGQGISLDTTTTKATANVDKSYDMEYWATHNDTTASNRTRKGLRRRLREQGQAEGHVGGSPVVSDKKAALKIQSAWRGRLTRKRLRRRSIAATEIQRLLRGILVRMRHKSKQERRKRLLESERERIQRLREIKRKEQQFLLLKAMPVDDFLDLHRLKRESSARALQRVWRTYQSKKFGTQLAASYGSWANTLKTIRQANAAATLARQEKEMREQRETDKLHELVYSTVVKTHSDHENIEVPTFDLDALTLAQLHRRIKDISRLKQKSKSSSVDPSEYGPSATAPGLSESLVSMGGSIFGDTMNGGAKTPSGRRPVAGGRGQQYQELVDIQQRRQELWAEYEEHSEDMATTQLHRMECFQRCKKLTSTLLSPPSLEEARLLLKGKMNPDRLNATSSIDSGTSSTVLQQWATTLGCPQKSVDASIESSATIPLENLDEAVDRHIRTAQVLKNRDRWSIVTAPHDIAGPPVDITTFDISPSSLTTRQTFLQQQQDFNQFDDQSLWWVSYCNQPSRRPLPPTPSQDQPASTSSTIQHQQQHRSSLSHLVEEKIPDTTLTNITCKNEIKEVVGLVDGRALQEYLCHLDVQGEMRRLEKMEMEVTKEQERISRKAKQIAQEVLRRRQSKAKEEGRAVLSEEEKRRQNLAAAKIQARARGSTARARFKTNLAENRVVMALQQLVTELGRPELRMNADGSGTSPLVQVDSLLRKLMTGRVNATSTLTSSRVGTGLTSTSTRKDINRSVSPAIQRRVTMESTTSGHVHDNHRNEELQNQQQRPLVVSSRDKSPDELHRSMPLLDTDFSLDLSYGGDGENIGTGVPSGGYISPPSVSPQDSESLVASPIYSSPQRNKFNRMDGRFSTSNNSSTSKNRQSSEDLASLLDSLQTAITTSMSRKSSVNESFRTTSEAIAHSNKLSTITIEMLTWSRSATVTNFVKAPALALLRSLAVACSPLALQLWLSSYVTTVSTATTGASTPSHESPPTVSGIPVDTLTKLLVELSCQLGLVTAASSSQRDHLRHFCVLLRVLGGPIGVIGVFELLGLAEDEWIDASLPEGGVRLSSWILDLRHRMLLLQASRRSASARAGLRALLPEAYEDKTLMSQQAVHSLLTAKLGTSLTVEETNVIVMYVAFDVKAESLSVAALTDWLCGPVPSSFRTLQQRVNMFLKVCTGAIEDIQMMLGGQSAKAPKSNDSSTVSKRYSKSVAGTRDRLAFSPSAAANSSSSRKFPPLPSASSNSRLMVTLDHFCTSVRMARQIPLNMSEAHALGKLLSRAPSTSIDTNISETARTQRTKGKIQDASPRLVVEVELLESILKGEFINAPLTC